MKLFLTFMRIILQITNQFGIISDKSLILVVFLNYKALNASKNS